MFNISLPSQCKYSIDHILNVTKIKRVIEELMEGGLWFISSEVPQEYALIYVPTQLSD